MNMLGYFLPLRYNCFVIMGKYIHVYIIIIFQIAALDITLEQSAYSVRETKHKLTNSLAVQTESESIQYYTHSSNY